MLERKGIESYRHTRLVTVTHGDNVQLFAEWRRGVIRYETGLYLNIAKKSV
jgi:hypothetical protein